MKRLLLIGLVGLSLVGCSNGNEITEEQILASQQSREQMLLEKQQKEEQHEQELHQVIELINENPRQGLIKMVNVIECSGEAQRVLHAFEYNYESNHSLGVLTSEVYELESGYWVKIIYCRNGDRIVAVSDSRYGDSFISKKF